MPLAGFGGMVAGCLVLPLQLLNGFVLFFDQVATGMVNALRTFSDPAQTRLPAIFLCAPSLKSSLHRLDNLDEEVARVAPLSPDRFEAMRRAYRTATAARDLFDRVKRSTDDLVASRSSVQQLAGLISHPRHAKELGLAPAAAAHLAERLNSCDVVSFSTLCLLLREEDA